MDECQTRTMAGYPKAVTPATSHAPASVAGMVAFYDEQVDTFLGGELRERPRTHFSPSD